MQPSLMSRLLIVGVGVAAAVGCQGDESRPLAGGESRAGEETVLVHDSPEGSWEGRREFVDDLTIGRIDGPVEYSLGDVTAAVMDSDGGIYAFDRHVPAIRHYGADGRYVKTIGGEGEGPGEYSDAVLGLALSSTGQLVVYDGGNPRIVVYEADGSPSTHWPVPGGLFADNALFLDSLDNVYIKIMAASWEGRDVDRRRPRRWPWPIGLLHLDGSGTVVDTLMPPSIPGEPLGPTGPLTPNKVFTVHPSMTVVGLNDQLQFDIRRRGGATIRVSRDFEPVPMSDTEWQAWEARREWKQRSDDPGSAESEPRTPRVKPAYESFWVDHVGRIWVKRYLASFESLELPDSEPGSMPPAPPQRTAFDVFASTGNFLGQVRLPQSTRLLWIGRDHAVGIGRGALEEQYIVRMRLE